MSYFNFSSNTLLIRLRGLKNPPKLLVIRQRSRRDPRTNTCPQHYGHISVLRLTETRETSVRRSSNKINNVSSPALRRSSTFCASHRMYIKNTAVMATVDGIVPNI